MYVCRSDPTATEQVLTRYNSESVSRGDPGLQKLRAGECWVSDTRPQFDLGLLHQDASSEKVFR